MISHEHKCIFIHVPRTAGTSIEIAFIGEDMWKSHPNEKHITASQAKDIYSEYWDNYFKFSIVRNPWDRVISLYHFKAFRNINFIADKSLLYFLNHYKPYPHEPNPCSLENMIDEPLDFIGRFENLSDDFNTICKKLGCDMVLPHIQKTCHKHYSEYYDKETRQIVAERYSDDIKRFGYDFA